MEEGKMRVTAHNGRAGKDGAYSPKHNDRNFDLKAAEHIDIDRMSGNWYWHCYQKQRPEMTFEDVERLFYENHFAKALEAQNKRHIEAGHKSRVRTMDQYREFKLSCPEEIIVQIGKDGQTVDPELLRKICIQHINWMQKKYPNIRILNVALHVDEEGAPHMHIRLVWIGHKNGLEVVGQNKALEEMGIARPHPEKPKDRHNNPKITYTRECREHLLEVCRKHGLEIEEEPKEASKSGLSLLEYQRQQEQEKLQALEKENAKLMEEARQAKEDMQKAKKEASQAKKEASQAKDEAHQAKVEAAEAKCQAAESWEEIRQLKVSSKKFQEDIKQAQERLTELSDKNEELNEINSQLEIARQQFRDTVDQKARASEIHRVFGDKETQTYHKNMLESTRKIGSEAYNRLKEAQTMEQAIAVRETALKRREGQINDMYEAADQALRIAKTKKAEIDTYIARSAEIVANKVIQQMQPMTDREWELRQFLARYTIGSKSMYQIFCDEEKGRNEAAQKQLGQEIKQGVEEYLKDAHDWEDLDLEP